MDQLIVTLVTASSEEEALTIARALVEERLAACANIIPAIRSIYRWEGKICDEPECYLIIKTRESLFSALQERIQTLHTYDVPEIIALPIVEGSKAYFDWIREETVMSQ